MKKIWIAALLLSGTTSLRAASTDKSGAQDMQEERNESQACEFCLFQKDKTGNPAARVLVKQDRIEILDENGAPKNTIPLENDRATGVETHLYRDRNGKVIGVEVTRRHEPRKERAMGGEYYILDANGNKTLDLNPFTDATHPKPSPSGDYAVGWSEEMGPPFFYDAQGVRNAWAKKWYDRAKKGFKNGAAVDEWPDLFEASSALFSPDGTRVAVSGLGPGPRGILVVYDAYGQKLFQTDAAGDPLFSKDGNLMAYGKPGKIGMTDASGNVLWEKAGGWIPAKFSDDAKFLILRVHQKLTMLDASTGKISWEWEPTPEKLAALRNNEPQATHGPLKNHSGLSILLVDAARDLSRIIVLGSTLKEIPVVVGKPQSRITSDKDHLLVFDKQGHLLAWKEFPGHTFPKAVGEISISISDKGDTVAVPGVDGVRYFHLKEDKQPE